MPNHKPTHDLAIIGAGPAGLTAALYACREGLDVILLEKEITGGKMITAELIENFPGFPEGISGSELGSNILRQAEKFGLKVSNAEAIDIKFTLDGYKTLVTNNLENITAKAIIISTGSSPAKLSVDNEDHLRGRGVSYCAICDGPLFRNVPVAVVGGGNSALEEALFLTRFASKVYIIHRRKKLKADQILKDRASQNKKIEVVFDSSVTGIIGSNKLEEIEVVNNIDNSKKLLRVNGLFIYIGAIPNTSFLPSFIQINEHGYIKTDRNLQTSVTGVFAVGDVRETPLRQVITAAADGALAATMAYHYIEHLGISKFD
ncbi:MAG: thioredoxin-disulfide reductase [bacterium]